MKKEDVRSIQDFEEVMNGYKMSSAPLEVREVAMKELKLMYPDFDTTQKDQNQEVVDMIKAAAPDTSDMGGNF